MSDRDNSRAQGEALRAARDIGTTEGRRAHEDALARYLRLQSEHSVRPERHGEEPEQADTDEK